MGLWELLRSRNFTALGFWRSDARGLRLARVLDAMVRCKLLVALSLKVPHHRVEILPGRRTGWVEDPSTFGTAPTTKARLVYPHHLARHGPHYMQQFHVEQY